MIASEPLLPGTRAITTLTLQWEAYRGRELIRLRHRNGSVTRRLFKTTQEANAFFQQSLTQLRHEAHKEKEQT